MQDSDAGESALLNRRPDRRLRLRVETANLAWVRLLLYCHLAGRIRLRIESVGGAHAEPESGQCDAA
jgi:hypothetical protein